MVIYYTNKHNTPVLLNNDTVILVEENTLSTPITELDFNQIKTNLKNYLQSQSEFADYDYDASTLSVVLDVLAYNTYMNSFYTNMAMSEMFLDSAQLRTSVISHAKELNYLPRSYRSSQANLSLSFTPDDSPAFITIPKYTKFNSTIDGVSYNFTTDEVYTVTPSNTGIYSVNNVIIYEGRIEKEYYNVTNSSKYVISNKKVDTNSIVVRVYSSSDSDSLYEEYVYKQNLFDVQSTDKVFYLQSTEKEKYEIEFGGNVFGKEPTVGEVVEVTYRVATGEEPNGASTFSPASTIAGYTATTTTVGVAEGGAVQETLESIKFYAPKALQVQDRAVTENDYVNLLKRRFSEIQAVSVYGGEELDPPQYGKVIVAVDVKSADGVSENSKNKFKEFLQNRSPLAIQPVIISPEFLYVSLEGTVYYNTRISDASPSAVETIVRNAIQSYSDTYLNDFNKNARQSRITRHIDDSSEYVIGNDTKIKMVIDVVPELNSVSSFTLNFRNSLMIDHKLTLGEDITRHNPAIKSSKFTYENTDAFLQDDGDGNLQILTNTIEGFDVLNSSIGSVDYDTGKVIITNLNVSGYDGLAIKIFGQPAKQDIFGQKEKIIAIRPEDVILTIEQSDE